jgi:hypothetical protein
VGRTAKGVHARLVTALLVAAGDDSERGFDVFALDHPAVRGAAVLQRNNPQTQERLFR